MIFSQNEDFFRQSMRTDIKEKDGQYLIEIELPGYEKENIEAQLENGYLTIIAERKEEIESLESETHFVLKERRAGIVKRTFFVGEDVKQTDISAALKSGILSVIIVKSDKQVEGERRKLIPIKDGE